MRACGRSRLALREDGTIGKRDLLSGLIRLQILHHAAHEPIFGLGIIEELGRHGYQLSAGTLYPILHGLEKSGYVISWTEFVAGRPRRRYVITDSGPAVLALAKTKVWERFRERFEAELHFSIADRIEPGEKMSLDGMPGEPAKRQDQKGKRQEST